MDFNKNLSFLTNYLILIFRVCLFTKFYPLTLSIKSIQIGMKIRPTLFLLSLLLGGWFSASIQFDSENANQIEEQKKLNHVVLCWLKEPGDRENIEKIIAMTQSFQEIPEVLDAQAGRGVLSDRRIVDDSFDVGILIQVQDEAAL